MERRTWFGSIHYSDGMLNGTVGHRIPSVSPKVITFSLQINLKVIISVHQQGRGDRFNWPGYPSPPPSPSRGLDLARVVGKRTLPLPSHINPHLSSHQTRPNRWVLYSPMDRIYPSLPSMDKRVAPLKAFPSLVLRSWSVKTFPSSSDMRTQLLNEDKEFHCAQYISLVAALY